jgi:hypothetical protein
MLTAALPAALLLVGTARADVPDPDQSIVPNVVYSPSSSFPYTVTVNSSTGALEGAVVSLVFSPAADALVCWCEGQDHPQISAVTDNLGQATFLIGGGGCVDPARLGGVVVEVFAEGVKLAEVGAVSPDAADDNGILPTSGWNPGGTCEAGLTDAVFHTVPFASGAFEFCSDMNSDGNVGLDDVVLATPDLAQGSACTAQ